MEVIAVLNLIICEDSKSFMQKNVDCINVALADNDIDYRIHKFDKYSSELESIIRNKEMKKIYILDVEMKGLSGIEIASRIREDYWESIIIIATAFDKYHDDVFYSRLMVLDFVCKYSGYEKRLMDDIKAALKIIYKQKTFVFKYNHVAYRIPYNHICYIEKEPIIKRCIIHTMKNQFYIVKSINWLEQNLGSDFVKTHQSCIVNLNNIKEVDFSDNVITFKNGESTCLFADKMKKEVKELVGLNK